MLSGEWKNKDIGQEKTLESLNFNIAKIRLGNYLVILAKMVALVYLMFARGLRSFKQTTTTTATRTSSNKRFNEQNNGYARAL